MDNIKKTEYSNYNYNGKNTDIISTLDQYFNSLDPRISESLAESYGDWRERIPEKFRGSINGLFAKNAGE